MVLHVRDASRCVGVLDRLTRPEQREQFDRENRAMQKREREAFAQRKQRKLVPYVEALRRRYAIDWTKHRRADAAPLAMPSFLGRRVLRDFPLAEVVPFIDWSPFFSAWELSGKYPAILDDPKAGREARKLFADAQTLLRRIVDEKLLRANAVYGFWPANSEGDDIVIYADESRSADLVRFPMLRQQWEREGQTTFRSLADYVAPKESGIADYLGAFAVTAGVGLAELVNSYKAAHDDYNAIMVEALADRLAEGMAELLHARARRDWGYGKDERLSNVDLIAEKYRGIRPAAGYPSCPDHS